HGLFIERIGEPIVGCRYGADDKTMALAISLDDNQSRLDSVLEARSNAIMEAVSGAEARVDGAFSDKTDAIRTAYTDNQ
ncbi:hypothetical protein ACCT04_36885, partial [Rhizobium ruizarguesonis]